MKNLTRFVFFPFQPRIFLLIIFIVHVSIWSYVTFRPFKIQPPGTTYAMPREQTSYVSYIRQAKNGAWCLIDNRTTKDTPCVYAYLYFVALGKLAAVFSIDPVSMYMVSQVLGGTTLFVATYVFISFLFPKKFRSFVLFFIFLVQVGPLLSTYLLEHFYLPPYAVIPVESSQLLFFRQFGLPHHTMGEAIGLLVLTVLLSSYTKNTTIKSALAIAVGTIAGVNILAPYFVTIVMAIFPAILAYAVSTRTVKKLLLPASIYVISFTIATLVLRSQLGLGPPWNTVYQIEKTWWTIPDLLVRYITSVYLYLPFILLALFTMPFFWRKTTEHLRLALTMGIGWLCIPVIIMPFTSLPQFPIASFRLIDGYQYVPAGILAAIGIMGVTTIVKNKYLGRMIIIVLISTVGWFSYDLTHNYMGGILNEQTNTWINVYPANPFWHAVEFFHTVPKNSGVLASEHYGQLLADYAPIRSFIGKTPGFPDILERRGLMGWFFEGTRTDQTARDILNLGHIDYVYWGDDEKRYFKSGTLYPNLLTPVFEEQGVIIYKVKQ